jgi:hypothetical protein
MRAIDEISKKLKMNFINWEGIISFTMGSWKIIPIEILDTILNNELKNKDINYIIKIIKNEFKNVKYNQWSILPNNILVVR